MVITCDEAKHHAETEMETFDLNRGCLYILATNLKRHLINERRIDSMSYFH